MNNKERLEKLRNNLVTLFASCANDVREVIYASEDKATVQNDAQEPRVIKSLFGVIPIFDLAREERYNGKDAKNIATKYSYAYALCRSEESLARDKIMLTDGIIAKWGQAQMLKIMPELIEDPDPEIQSDIAALLQRVEGVAEGFGRSHKYYLVDPRKSANRPHLNLGDVLGDDKGARLTIARKVLADVQKISVQNILSKTPSPEM